jgi:methylated-DNA-[protein]-cysteine S-methyltransferase
MMFYQFFLSPVGWLRISASVNSLRQISFLEADPDADANPNEITAYVVKQLQAYFRREPTEDIYRLVRKGSQFQRKVWEQALKIPAGKTMSYQQMALSLGDIQQTRAVARALATNPILVLIPCHRILGKDGKLRGYAGSPSRKQWLLQFEAREIEQLTLFPIR